MREIVFFSLWGDLSGKGDGAWSGGGGRGRCDGEEMKSCA